MADIRTVAVRPQSADGSSRQRSDLRPPHRLLSVLAAGLAALDRLADDHRGRDLDRVDLFCGGSRRRARDDAGRDRSDDAARGVSITSAAVLLAIAAQVYLGRFERLLTDHTIFAGVTYTDANVAIPGCCW